MEFRGVTVIPVNGSGPEDVVVDAKGQVYTGLSDGRIIRVSEDGKLIEVIAETPGRPLGLEFFGPDELLVCASDHGLLVVSLSTGVVRTLADTALGTPILSCNNAAVAADGTVYFSDSSRIYPIPQWRKEMLEQTGTGRLLRRDPDGTIEVVLGGLQFANGVALTPDESFVTVAETTTRRLRRVSLTGSSAGKAEVLVDQLSGYPDNVATGSDGLIWVAVPSSVMPVVWFAQRMPGPVRSVVHRVPESLQPQPSRTVRALGVDTDGRIVQDYQGEIDGFRMLTGIRERDGKLYFGSLSEHAIAVMNL